MEVHCGINFLDTHNNKQFLMKLRSQGVFSCFYSFCIYLKENEQYQRVSELQFSIDILIFIKLQPKITNLASIICRY
jgi:hypothetical protein